MSRRSKRERAIRRDLFRKFKRGEDMTKFELNELEDINRNEVRLVESLCLLFLFGAVFVSAVLESTDPVGEEFLSVMASIGVFFLLAFFQFGVVSIYCRVVGQRIRKRSQGLGSLGEIIEKGRSEIARRDVSYPRLA